MHAIRMPLVCAFALVCLACGEPAEPPGPGPGSGPAPAPEEVAIPEPDPLMELPPFEAGRALYAQLECAGCHESAAVPGLIVTPLIKLGSRFTPETLSAFLSAPPEPMPNFELAQWERDGLAAYLLATYN